MCGYNTQYPKLGIEYPEQCSFHDMILDID